MGLILSKYWLFSHLCICEKSHSVPDRIIPPINFFLYFYSEECSSNCCDGNNPDCSSAPPGWQQYWHGTPCATVWLFTVSQNNDKDWINNDRMISDGDGMVLAILLYFFSNFRPLCDWKEWTHVIHLYIYLYIHT